MNIKKMMQQAQKMQEQMAAAQEELADIALEIEAELKGGVYQASAEELVGIDRGLKAAREGRFATDEEVEAVLAKHQKA